METNTMKNSIIDELNADLNGVRNQMVNMTPRVHREKENEVKKFIFPV